MSQLKIVDELITTGFVFQLYLHHPYFKFWRGTKNTWIHQEAKIKF